MKATDDDQFTFPRYTMADFQYSVVGMDEDLPVTLHHSIYPAVDPKAHFDKRSYQDKVVLVTGASRGIGREVAVFYARAGASVVIVARAQEALAETKKIIESAVPEAQVLAIAVDVKDWEKAEEAVSAAIARFGRLDILIANAGAISPVATLMGDKDPTQWWNTFEVNIFGVFNFVRPALPHLVTAKGYIVVISSEVAQLRAPGSSDYGVSKHALGRLVELIVTEYPGIKAFTVHPGKIPTQMAADCKLDPRVPLPDSVELPASTLLHLTSGKMDWLTGKYVSSNWDLGEVEKLWKEQIVGDGALVAKLHIPLAHETKA
ncbi:NAD-P-binding protein [Amylostereum chailletii]|nr:NAD-P-binding protein [Amylostereum chailletii]